MKRSIWLVLIPLIAISAVGTTWYRLQEPNYDGFEKWKLPMDRLDRFFDVGVVDANDDGNLDIYTSTHHFRQLLLISDGKGRFRDVHAEGSILFSRRDLVAVGIKHRRFGR